MDQTETAFTVLDALGLARLVKRRGDLGGSVPLRVARGCDPLFEGNAFGFQVTLRHPIALRRGPAGMVVEMDPAHEALAAQHRALLPRLVAQGFLPEGFSDQAVQVEDMGSGRVCVRLWTGLCVRADPGVWLRVSATANRRNRLIEVAEEFIPDTGAFAPLFLTVELGAHVPDRVSLAGEVGTLAPVAPGARFDEVPLAAAPEIAAAHVAFYDQAYYATKRGQVTRKYRKLDQPEAARRDLAPARCRVVTVGPSAHAVGTHPVSSVTFANLVPFEATYDGYAFNVVSDQARLQAGANAVEQAFAQALGPAAIAQASPRALMYFTKYFTLHPPGEPHFFVKPWAFVQTPPGWSCLLEGVHGEGFDVLRGVVATDVFHATPAVFQVDRVGEPVRVGLGQPLVRVLPIPRWLIAAGFREAALS